MAKKSVASARIRKKKEMLRIWAAMIDRCFNPASREYKNYGVRGITVSQRWLDFKVFRKDMGYPDKGYPHLIRLNQEKGYSTKNCEWSRTAEVCEKKARDRMLTYAGKTRSLSEWADETGIPHSTLCSRLNSLGWSVRDTLTKPIKKRVKARRYPYKGKIQTAREWEIALGFKRNTLVYRLKQAKRGWNKKLLENFVAEVIEKPIQEH